MSFVQQCYEVTGARPLGQKLWSDSLKALSTARGLHSWHPQASSARQVVSTATLNEHGETFNVSTAGTNAMATLCVASRSCQGRKSSI